MPLRNNWTKKIPIKDGWYFWVESSDGFNYPREWYCFLILKDEDGDTNNPLSYLFFENINETVPPTGGWYKLIKLCL